MSGQTARLIAVPARPSGQPVRANTVVSPGTYVISGVEAQALPVANASIPLTLLNDAQAEAEAQRPESACRLLEQIIERWPSHVPALLLLGCLRQSGGEGQEARRLYRLIHEKQPDCWQALYNEALLDLAEGDREAAINRLKEACALAPAEPEPMFRLALALEEAGRYREALVWYRRAVGVRETFPSAWLRAALILMRFGLWAEAAAAIEHCLDSEEDGAAMWYHYALCQLELGDGEKARMALEESHRRRNDSAPVLRALALLSVLDGNLELAVRYEKAAAEYGEPSASIIYRLALAFQERGNHEQARRFYMQAVKLDPSLATGYFN